MSESRIEYVILPVPHPSPHDIIVPPHVLSAWRFVVSAGYHECGEQRALVVAVTSPPTASTAE